MVRETREFNGAELIQEYCRRRGDIKAAIEFLLIGNNKKEAFHLASTHDEMEVFEKSLHSSQTGEYIQIAEYYESRHLIQKAAENFTIAGEYQKALSLYLRSGLPFSSLNNFQREVALQKLSSFSQFLTQTYLSWEK